MKIEIIGAESLGVRGLCCSVASAGRTILIDPGIALGFIRHGLLPHPVQVAADEMIRERIIKAWRSATDIVISHFHGDHVPLAAANSYQLDIDRVANLNAGVRIWTKSSAHLSAKEGKRFGDLKERLDAQWLEGSQGLCPMLFSMPVPHGEKTGHHDRVMMTRIEEDKVFVHASDIQLLDNDTVDLLINWRPDILLAGGPPLYLEQVSQKQRDRAWQNALRLAGSVKTLILDHHLMRSHEGLQWLERLSSRIGRRVLCAADFMATPRRLLEADRKALYARMPVPPEWHQNYAEGKASTRGFEL